MSIKSGDQVREWQKSLHEAGYDVGDEPGIWGAGTSAATKEFQKSNGLNPNGQVDKKTWDALKACLAGEEAQVPAAAVKKPFYKTPLFWVAASSAVLVGFAALTRGKEE